MVVIFGVMMCNVSVKIISEGWWWVQKAKSKCDGQILMVFLQCRTSANWGTLSSRCHAATYWSGVIGETPQNCVRIFIIISTSIIIIIFTIFTSVMILKCISQVQWPACRRRFKRGGKFSVSVLRTKKPSAANYLEKICPTIFCNEIFMKTSL